MAKSRRRHNQCCNNRHGLPQYWQAASNQEQYFEYYRNLILSMAMSRFKWIGLPPTCNERYLEYILVTQGMATIATPKDAKGLFYSTQVAEAGKMNIYDNPVSWASFGNNGWHFECDHTNGVIIYDNITRFPLLIGIEQYARELSQIRVTKKINRLHQQIPFLLKGDQRQKQDLVNIFKNIASGEPAILVTNGFDGIDVDKIDTDVQYLGEELAQDEANIWNRIYTMLGMNNTLYKRERQTEDEIQAYTSASDKVLLASLNERRRAANLLNERFGDMLPDEIHVIAAYDNESDNFNFYENVQTQMKLGGDEQ